MEKRVSVQSVSPDRLRSREINRTDILVGRVFGHLRRAEGVSQRELGDLWGVSEAQVEAIETGLEKLSVTRLYQAATFLNFDPRDFVHYLGDYLAHDGGE